MGLKIGAHLSDHFPLGSFFRIFVSFTLSTIQNSRFIIIVIQEENFDLLSIFYTISFEVMNYAAQILIKFLLLR